MSTERNCQYCKYYKDGYCENLELKPYYPQKGCDDFENKDLDVLDKIRTEIEQIADEEQKHDEKWAIGLRYAIKIIDKYKAERSE